MLSVVCSLLSLCVGGRQVDSNVLVARESADKVQMKIGDVTVVHERPARSDLVPDGYAVKFGASPGSPPSPEALAHLRWIAQKDVLGQDVFLTGAPGPTRRRLAMLYCELFHREVEYVCISRDTSDSDLKQRREIVDGTSTFVDQAPVRAALQGRVLILDNVEKAERCVLPALNNLLEARCVYVPRIAPETSPRRTPVPDPLRGCRPQGDGTGGRPVPCEQSALRRASGNKERCRAGGGGSGSHPSCVSSNCAGRPSARVPRIPAGPTASFPVRGLLCVCRSYADYAVLLGRVPI
jgi:hypothetical protein